MGAKTRSGGSEAAAETVIAKDAERNRQESGPEAGKTMKIVIIGAGSGSFGRCQVVDVLKQAAEELRKVRFEMQQDFLPEFK